MNILVLYGTTEGQTRKVCAFIAERLRAKGDVVTVVNAAAPGAPFDLRDFQAAIVAASIHVGQYQSAVVEFARVHHASLNHMPSAFVSVSLSMVDSDAEELLSLATITENFKAYTGWTNAEIHHVAGALRVGAYDFFKRWVMRLVAWEKKLKLEPGKDLELTDWEALAVTVDGLHARFVETVARKKD
ncbi:MAG: protoporphyrinogen oxidase [Alphaproteobacteria bacterium]|nr:protoporphyrinogen oxidase [Alphaproteobacteria bacterium]